MTSGASKASGSETRALTPEQRARLVEVMTRGVWGEKWDRLALPERLCWLSWYDQAIAAAERAGFRIEGPE